MLVCLWWTSRCRWSSGAGPRPASSQVGSHYPGPTKVSGPPAARPKGVTSSRVSGMPRTAPVGFSWSRWGAPIVVESRLGILCPNLVSESWCPNRVCESCVRTVCPNRVSESWCPNRVSILCRGHHSGSRSMRLQLPVETHCRGVPSKSHARAWVDLQASVAVRDEAGERVCRRGRVRAGCRSLDLKRQPRSSSPSPCWVSDHQCLLNGSASPRCGWMCRVPCGCPPWPPNSPLAHIAARENVQQPQPSLWPWSP